MFNLSISKHSECGVLRCLKMYVFVRLESTTNLNYNLIIFGTSKNLPLKQESFDIRHLRRSDSLLDI
jgi:hypothetical protein